MKSSHCQRKDGVDDNFMEGEEENGLTLMRRISSQSTIVTGGSKSPLRRM